MHFFGLRSNTKAILTSMVGIAFFFCLLFVQLNGSLTEVLQRKPQVAPPVALRHFQLGHREFLADSLFLRAIQDFDFCSQKIDKVNCVNKGWLFQTLDIASDLYPEYRGIIATGTLSLSVLVSDIAGASALFDKAVERYPHDWPILYRAAYHALYEENNKPKAADLLLKAGRAGANPWVYSLAGRLYTDSGKKELGELVLKEMKDSNLPEEFISRLEKKLSSSHQ